MEFPAPARYFPPRTGKYDVKPNLLLLATDFGNGTMDGRVFQFDTDWPRFRQNKEACRGENRTKYVLQTLNMDALTQKAVGDFLRARLCAEYPASFAYVPAGNDGCVLHCRLTGERLSFAEDGTLTNAAENDTVAPPYADAWDALCCQFPEDMAVVRVNSATGTDETLALHLCAPSHWRGEDKIGHGFLSTHLPVPGMGKISAASGPLLKGVMERGPFVRFTWGIEFDDRLNHHPDAPPGVADSEWNRRVFDPRADVPAYLRVERQVFWGLPEASVFVFAIRVYLTDARDLPGDEQILLARALRSMSPESRAYKGLTEWAEPVAEWLDGLGKAPLPPNKGGF